MSFTATVHPLRSLPATFLSLLLASSSAIAQSPTPQPPPTPSPNPTFDVSTIKPHQDDTSGRARMIGILNTPDGFNASRTTLYLLVRSAYGLLISSQINGGPDWAKTLSYDLQAKMSVADAEAFNTLSPADQKTRRQQMLQALLADRFKLKTHTETKQVPTFDLVTTKDISRLKPDPETKLDKDAPPSQRMARFGKDSSSFVGETMANFAGFLSQTISGVGRPVIDKTSLTSTYSFTLNWAPQWRGMPGAAGPPPSDNDTGPSIFTALADLGLKLQPSTGPIQIIVIDHAERPTAD